MKDNTLFPNPVRPGSLMRWLGVGWQVVRQRPLLHAWLSVCALLPLVFIFRWWPPFGWMVGLTMMPVFLAIPLCCQNRLAATGSAPLWCVLDPWYAPLLRKRLLVLGGFLAVLGVVGFGLQLSVVAGSAILLAGAGAGDAVGSAGTPVLLLANLALVGIWLLAVLFALMAFLFAVPLVVQRPVPTLHAMGASVALWRRQPGLSLAFVGLMLALVLLALPTLGLSVLLGFPVVAVAIYCATDELFPA